MQKSVYSPEQEKLQRLLRTSRLRAGLRQVDLAARLEVPQSVVSKVERGERRLDILELRQLCHELGIKLRDFVDALEEELEPRDQPR